MEVFTFNCTDALIDSPLDSKARNTLQVWLFPCTSPTTAVGLLNEKFPFLLVLTSLVQMHILLLSVQKAEWK